LLVNDVPPACGCERPQQRERDVAAVAAEFYKRGWNIKADQSTDRALR
jgi:hypothetical protein